VSASAIDPDVSDRMQSVMHRAFLAGAVGLLFCVIFALFGENMRTQMFRAYLWAFTYWLGIPLGCLVVLMIKHLTGGAWGYALQRLLEAATRTFPLLAVLYLPLGIVGLPYLYEWADPAAVEASEHLQHQREFYLRPDLAWMRVVIYFGVWIGLALTLNRWSRRDEEVPDPNMPQRFRTLSGIGLGLYGITMTFAAIDWVMSLEPRWSSTIYGPMFGMGQVVSGFSFILIVAMLLRSDTPLLGALGRFVMRDCSNLLMAFIMVWMYLSFSQFLLIWSGNLPEEITWYLARSQTGWQWVAIALVLFHFAVPFALLLSREYKQDPRRLAGVALLLLCMEAVNLFWLIMPGFGMHDGEPSGNGIGFTMILLGPAAMVGVGGLWVGAFLWQLGQRPLLPLHAPEGLEEKTHG
jgi:hypothetical protein